MDNQIDRNYSELVKRLRAVDSIRDKMRDELMSDADFRDFVINLFEEKKNG